MRAPRLGLRRADDRRRLAALATVAGENARLRAELAVMRSALESIRGPADEGAWITAYRAAGGGYAGLQVIAEAALDEVQRLHR